jgi:hypothetical protein
MKKLNRIFNVISINILILFAIGFLGTYLSEVLSENGMFGDFENSSGRVEWGVRHCWYFWGIFFLFVANIGRAVARVVVVVKEEYPELNNY